MSIASTLAEVRASLTELGIPEPEVTLATRDQVVAGFRTDLLSLGIDPAEDIVEPVLAGLAVGLKIIIAQSVPLPLIAHYMIICEVLQAQLIEGLTDISGLPDPELAFSCSKCGGSNAVVPVGGLHLCAGCAGELVQGGMAAMRLSGVSRPQVGGPMFDRGPDVADVGPPRSWRDKTLSELFGRKRKEQHGKA